MDLLQSLKQLRDDIKSWVTVNLNAINTKVEQNTIHVDSELNPASTNPIQNKVIAEELRNLSTEITNKPGFSGDYNDLTNAPNIIEDESGDMIIADNNGNVIFKADSDGIHTTALTLDGEPAATEKYVNDKVDVVNAKVDNIKIPEVDLSNHYTKEETNAAINSAKEELSESITTESSEWTVVDEAGNIIFKVDSEGAHTTSLSLKDGEPVATVTYVNDEITKVNESVNNINDQLDNLNIPNLQGYATEEYVNNAVSEHAEDVLDTHYTKTEIDTIVDATKESIMSESTEWKVVDEAGNIVFSVDSTGAHTTILTLNGQTVEEVATDKAKSEIAALVNSAPEALNTLSELANALGDDPNFATTITNEIGKKVDKVEGKDLSTNDFTDDYKNKLDGLNLDNITYEETDPTVPDWAKEPNKPTYTAKEVGLGNVDNTSDADKPISTATQAALDELKEEIMFESQEWHIVDENDNIVFSVDASGAHTTSLTLNNVPFEDIIAEKQDKITGTKGQLVGFDDNGNAIAQDKPVYTADEIGALSKNATLADLTDDENHRTVTDVEKSDWSAKATEEFVASKIAEAKLAESDVDLSAYYTKTEVDTKVNDSLTSYATKDYVGEEIGKIEFPTTDLTNYYNKSETDAAIKEAVDAFEETIPVWSKAENKPEYTADEVGALPDTTKLADLADDVDHRTVTDTEKEVWNAKATEDFVTQKIAEAALSGNDVDLTVYYTKSETNAAIDQKIEPLTTSIEDNKELFDAHIADTNAHVTSEEKTAWNNKSDFNGDYENLTNKPDLSKYYTETEVNNAITNADLSSKYALKETVDSHIGNDEIHVTATDKENWNTKSEFSGKYEDLTGIPDPIDLSKYALNETVEANKKLADDHAANEDIHVTATDKENWNNKSNFSGDYNDLVNAPNITEDESNNLVIADPDGNIIFRSDGSGFETTTLTADEAIVGGVDVNDFITNHIHLPEVTDADNGKILMVVNGTWQAVSLNLSVDDNGVLSI